MNERVTPLLLARIDTGIWGDPVFQALSVRAQWLYLAILTQPGLTSSGHLETSPSQLRDLVRGINADQTEQAAAALSKAELVHQSTDGMWVMHYQLSHTYLHLGGERPQPVGRRAIPISVRMAVFRRCDFQCARCGTTENLSLDHIHPHSKGGTDDEDNLQVLCQPCNSCKGAKLP